MDKVIEICLKYNLRVQYSNKLDTHATGIGDILMYLLCLKYKYITIPYHFNLNLFTSSYYMSEPINQLEFRIKLILDIIKYNNINKDDIIFIYNPIHKLKLDIPYNNIKKFLLNFENSNNINKEEYIIFHTKLRQNINPSEINKLKDKIKEFCKEFKSKYVIYIMGEKVFPITEESIKIGINTIYDELIELKNNNNINNVCIDNIYNNLNYDNYKKDIELIKNAKYNICFGQGGQLCTSLVFSKSTIFYYPLNTGNLQNENNLKENNHYYCSTIEDIFKIINQKCEFDNKLYKLIINEPINKPIQLNKSKKLINKQKDENIKETLLLYINYGLGDIINMSGAIRYYSNKYKVTIIITQNNLDNVKILFNDITDISYMVFKKQLFYKENIDIYNDINKSYNLVLKTGYHIDQKVFNIPYDYYDTLNLDYSIMQEYFRRKSINNENFEKIKNIEYIFIHTNASDFLYNLNLKTDKLIICPHKNYYKDTNNSEYYELADLFINLPFFEYTEIIENASELHLIDSSFYCYSLLLNTNVPLKKVYHRFSIKLIEGWESDDIKNSKINQKSFVLRHINSLRKKTI